LLISKNNKPEVVDIILELAKNGVQMFLATHDYNIARYLDVRKDKSVPVMFYNLSKTAGGIECKSSPDYIKLPDNLLESASTDLFNAVVAGAMGVQDDE
jgi:ABC-type histidine transport system ATPase subunit